MTILRKAVLLSWLSAVLFVCASCSSGGFHSNGDFAISAAPNMITLTPGSAQQISINATAVNGFTNAITISFSGLPAGVATQPASLMLMPGMPQVVTINADSSAMPGSATLVLTGTSGGVSHSSSVAITVASPPPDFTLVVAPASLTLTPGGPASSVQVTAIARNGFSGTVTTTISGLPTGVTAVPTALTLTSGIAQSVSFSAAAAASTTSTSVAFTGISDTLTHSASLALSVATSSPPTPNDVVTYHYDAARTGLNSAETILTISNVNSSQFGKTGFLAMDGKVDAQPLYVAGLPVGGRLHNVLYAGTEHGTLYAFDADDGSQLWHTSLLGSNETPSDDHGCSQISPEIGISATPVIDRQQGAHGIIFLVVTSKDQNGGYHHRLHAVDLTTGMETQAPTEISAIFPGTGANSQGGNVVFDPAPYAERAALLLVNGMIYTGWTSHCDQGAYTGWTMGYSETNLQQTQVLNITPNGNMGSVWMSGNGIAADSVGSLYLLVANGTFDTNLDSNGFPSKGDYGNSILRLSVTNGRLSVADYFTMHNTQSLSSQDVDLGSGGPLLLPDQTDSHGFVHHLIVGAGKDRNIYLADRDNLGKFNPASNPADNNIYQELPGANLGGSFSSAAYFNGVLYSAADGDSLKAYPMVDAKMSTTPSSMSGTRYPHPGPTPTVSANGTQSGIVWALESNTNSKAVLHAYDAGNLAHELYNSNQAANGRDSFGNGNKFITPMVIHGKVYVGTPTGVAVFGLLGP
ncbi:MAG TPA: hypothetical protein VHN81_08295 [Edaphobacter sp.]|nr:hypothetical protein [Edaphobacter sp.]